MLNTERCAVYETEAIEKRYLVFFKTLAKREILKNYKNNCR
jgi:hypothetical protein